MAVHVVQCPKCARRLRAVPADALDTACPDCGLAAPVEAFRWVGAGLERAQAERLMLEWNPRLARGLTPMEMREFSGLAP